MADPLLDRAEILTVRPGDRLMVVFPPGAITEPHDLDRLKALMEERFPDVEMVLLAGVAQVVHQPAEPVDEPHLIEFREDGWTIQHPLRCRPRLFDCPVNRAAEARNILKSPDAVGIYECDANEFGELVVGDRRC